MTFPEEDICAVFADRFVDVTALLQFLCLKILELHLCRYCCNRLGICRNLQKFRDSCYLLFAILQCKNNIDHVNTVRHLNMYARHLIKVRLSIRRLS